MADTGPVRSDAAVAALAALPGATPPRVHRLLGALDPAAAWRRVERGTVPASVAPAEVRAQWRLRAARVDLHRVAARLDEVGVVATTMRDRSHPPQLATDIDPAPILFIRGAIPDPELPHVAVVGTRRSSSPGREVARELGAGLAEAGVVVVSGLALGIDGAAHRGALLARAAPPLAIVGSGPDVVYPARHADLWAEIVDAGGLVTEAPLGAAAEPWRFPARNRLIAAFADLVVVVESRAAGGSLLTVDQAARRGVDVMAVPGSVRNPAAAGTNQLLADGCAPVRDVADVLVALGLDEVAQRARREPAPPPVPPELAVVLEAVDDGPTSVDEIVRCTGLAVLDVHAGVARLVATGHLRADGARVRRV